MFGFTALSVGQLKKVAAHVEATEANGDTVIGLVVNNPAGRTVEVSLIGQNGMPFAPATFGIAEDDLALTHPDLAATAPVI